jgi:hypothetical protein
MSAERSGDSSGQPGDERVLAMIKSVFEAADPVPAGLVDRIRFSVALAGWERDPECELARLIAEEAELARGVPEESRTITFDSSSLTIMIRIDPNADGTVRVDGWLAPPQPCQVEITQAGGPVTTDADVDGRFAFPSVPRGTVQLIVRRTEHGTAESKPGPFGMKAVITPALLLLRAHESGRAASHAGPPARAPGGECRAARRRRAPGAGRACRDRLAGRRRGLA